MYTLIIISIVVYFAGALLTDETLSKMYKLDGVWQHKIETRWITTLRMMCPIYNLVFPIYWRIRGINAKRK